MNLRELIKELQRLQSEHGGDLIVAIDGEVYTPILSTGKASYFCDETNMAFGVDAKTDILNIE